MPIMNVSKLMGREQLTICLDICSNYFNSSERSSFKMQLFYIHSTPIAPFNTTLFQKISADSTAILIQAEADLKRQVENLPKTVATSMHGILEPKIMERGCELEQQNKNHEEMKVRLNYIEAMIVETWKSSRRKR